MMASTTAGGSDQIVVVIKTIKLSKSVYQGAAASSSSGAGRNKQSVLGYIDAHYGSEKVFRTKETKLYSGSVFGIPYHPLLQRFSLHIAIAERDLTIDIGVCDIDVTAEQIHSMSDKQTLESLVHVTRSDGKERIGKISCCLSKLNPFAGMEVGGSNTSKYRSDMLLHSHKSDMKHTNDPSSLDLLSPLPDFKFNQLRRPIHWERLKNVHLDRIQRTNDTTALMSLAQDVAYGDVSQEEMDPKFDKILQISQYSVQYLLSCQQVLKHRQSLIKDALHVFETEEDELDIRLSKLRAREKALKRELKTLDFLQSEHSDLLATLDPLLSQGHYHITLLYTAY